ncbi:hypothetical protein GCM10010466_33020 [Planomonospora alba]|uniref:Uncharacterized protein n=1 Tax=Planomonospora alba TaxID=161354 RepID=A0ABP6N7S9_9ACTN
MSTDRLITCQRTSIGRTFAASSSHREVIQVQGQEGANQKSAIAVSVAVPVVVSVATGPPGSRLRASEDA